MGISPSRNRAIDIVECLRKIAEGRSGEHAMEEKMADRGKHFTRKGKGKSVCICPL